MEAELLAFCRERLAAFKCPRIDRLRRRPPPPGHRQALQAAPQGPLLGRPHVPHRLGQDRWTGRLDELPRLHPHQRGAGAVGRRPVGRQAARRPRRRAALLRRGRRPVGRRSPRACSRPAPARARGSGCWPANSPDWIVGWLGITRIGGVAVLLNTYNKAKELGWLLRHCRRPGAAHRRRATSATTTSSGSSRPSPAWPARSTSGSSSSRTPTCGRSGRGATGAGRGPAPVADLAGRGDVGQRRAARASARARSRRPTRWWSSTRRAAPPTRRAPSTPTAPRSATPTTSGRCATSSPTTCSTRRCRCSGSAASASR